VIRIILLPPTDTPISVNYCVPNNNCRLITSISTHAKRQKYAFSVFHRANYLKRLGLNKHNNRKWLDHCNNHLLYEEEHILPYLDIDYNRLLLTKVVRLPKDPNKAYIST
jgi:hypothetical protein